MDRQNLPLKLTALKIEVSATPMGINLVHTNRTHRMTTKKKTKTKTSKTTKRTNPARKKKSVKNRGEAHRRNSVYAKVLAISDPEQRRVAEGTFQRTYIPSTLLAKEAARHQTRCIGHRYMTPLQATQQFNDAYLVAYRRVWARHFSVTEAPGKQPIEASFAMNDLADMTSLWKARQRADELGMPYDLFCEIIMERWIVGRKAKQPPLPNQLCSGKLFNGWMRGHPTWAETSERLFLPDWDARFFAEPISDDPVHAAAMRMLHADVLYAKDRPARLARYLSVDGPLTEERAGTMFDPDLVRDAMALVGESADVDTATDAYVPACIGNRTDERDAPCRTCPYTAQCSALKRKVTRKLIATGGSGDPLADRRRQQDRERQQRRREELRRKKLPSAV